MDISPTTTPVSDDADLAKTLNGIESDDPQSAVITTPTPVVVPTTPPVNDYGTPASAADMPAAVPTSPLDDIKKSALQELQPLLSRVDLAPEEKFDTYLMLIRSTDDTSLIATAHDAAVQIADEKRRAEALLDIIKEIDFLTHKPN